MSGELRDLVEQLRERMPTIKTNLAGSVALVEAFERAEKALARDVGGEINLDFTVRVVDVMRSARELFGDATEQIIGHSPPEHDYRFTIVHPDGGRITFHRPATATDVVTYSRRMGWVRGESS